MNDIFSQRVRSAARAGWWTVLIGAIWLLAAWLIWLAIIHARPEWLRTLWGGRRYVAWKEMYLIAIQFMAIFKLILFVCVLATIWLSLWSRRLRRLAAS